MKECIPSFGIIKMRAIVFIFGVSILFAGSIAEWRAKADKKIKKYTTAAVIRGFGKDELNPFDLFSKKPSKEEVEEFQSIKDSVETSDKNDLINRIDGFLEKYPKSVFKSDLKSLKKLLK